MGSVKRRRPLELKRIKVWALVEDGEYVVVDARMRKRARLGQADLKKPSQRMRLRAKEQDAWTAWSSAAAGRLNGFQARDQARKADPWFCKIDAWMVSIYKRRIDLLRVRAKLPSRRLYPTPDWPGAITRMWHQANNKWARHRRTGWWRWCQSVTNNSNKRKGARYARDSMRREARGDQGERPAKIAGVAGLQLCFDW